MSHHRTSQSSRLLVHRSVLAAVALSLPMITGVAQASPLSMPAPPDLQCWPSR